MATTQVPTIRPFEPRDRANIRRLCFQTGDKGKTAQTFFPDAKLFSDLWTIYYTDFEPESTWIAECDGQFAAYTSACFSERRFHWITLLMALLRGTLFRLDLWRIVVPSAWGLLREPTTHFSPAIKSDGHLHINIDEKFRGAKLGGRLLAEVFKNARELGVSCLTADVRADNDQALRFFEKHGFVKIKEHPGFYVPGLNPPKVRGVLLAISIDRI